MLDAKRAEIQDEIDEAECITFSGYKAAERAAETKADVKTARANLARRYVEQRSKIADLEDEANEICHAHNEAAREHNARMYAMRRENLTLACCGTKRLEDTTASCLARLHYVLTGS